MFDGHGGVDAAIYASIHLHVNMVHQEMFQQDPAEALCRAFRVTDERFVQKAAREVTELPGPDSNSVNLYVVSWSAGLLRALCPQHRAVRVSPQSWCFVFHKDVALSFSQCPVHLAGCCCCSCVYLPTQFSPWGGFFSLISTTHIVLSSRKQE